jgi:hypothetical protein
MTTKSMMLLLASCISLLSCLSIGTGGRVRLQVIDECLAWYKQRAPEFDTNEIERVYVASVRSRFDVAFFKGGEPGWFGPRSPNFERLFFCGAHFEASSARVRVTKIEPILPNVPYDEQGVLEPAVLDEFPYEKIRLYLYIPSQNGFKQFDSMRGGSKRFWENQKYGD